MSKTATEEIQRDEIVHPDIEWCKRYVKEKKGERVTAEELDTIYWDSLMGCYGMRWGKMFLGIETDGHMHT